ncbi:MAG: SDR family NAD(P)-dependent oxidoreductase, partial [Candidatus Hydrogenedentota bacterium]
GALDGKVAVVTGAGRGIGHDIAMSFSREGANVVVNDLGGDVDGAGGSKVADEVVEEIKSAGGQAVANYDTVATPEGGQGIFQSAIDGFGAMDILVNNAGILRDRTIFNMEEADWDAVLAVHLKGHYCCTRPFAKYIRETNRPGCRILNFSSVSGLYGNFGQSNYGAAKSGIAGFSRVIALELEKYGTKVNTISPGASTRMTIALREARGVQVDVDAPDQSPKQIAEVVTWLASSASEDVNAQIIDVMQGWVGIMQQPAVIKSFTTDGMWTLDSLDKAMPALMDAKREHDAAVKEKGAPQPLG